MGGRPWRGRGAAVEEPGQRCTHPQPPGRLSGPLVPGGPASVSPPFGLGGCLRRVLGRTPNHGSPSAGTPADPWEEGLVPGEPASSASPPPLISARDLPPPPALCVQSPGARWCRKQEGAVRGRVSGRPGPPGCWGCWFPCVLTLPSLSRIQPRPPPARSHASAPSWWAEVVAGGRCRQGGPRVLSLGVRKRK